MASLRSSRAVCKRITAAASLPWLRPPRKPPCSPRMVIPEKNLGSSSQSAHFSSRPTLGFSALALLDHQKTQGLNEAILYGRRYASTTPVSSQLTPEAEVLADSSNSATEIATTIPDIMAPGTSEIAAAVADSSFPIAILQHLMDAVHTYTGLPWWASIVATTFAIRAFLLPVTIFQMKSTSKLVMVKPEMERHQQRMKAGGLSDKELERLQIEMRDIMKRHGVNPFAPFLGVLLQAPIFISFFFAIQTMAAKMPSLKEGGALWFTDLSIPDPFYIMPVLSGLSFLAMIELNAADGMESAAMSATFKNVMRVFALAIIPISATFPNAMFCYWLPANVFSLGQGVVLKIPGMKSKLGIPDVSQLTASMPQSPTNVAAATYMRSKKAPSLGAKSENFRGKR